MKATSTNVGNNGLQPQITASELRIGNLLNAIFYDTPIEVHSVCSVNDEIFNRTTGEIPLSSLSPIPLTEEWLLKFGFEIALNGYWDETENWCVRDNNFYVNAQTYLGKVDYVHQLQNLYFSLTGKEL